MATPSRPDTAGRAPSVGANHMSICDKNQRRFTEAAREAAAQARRLKREHRAQFPEDHQLVMVVVRAAEDPRAFAWQIRRFGHRDPVERSAGGFPDPTEAARAGQAVLDGMRSAMALEG